MRETTRLPLIETGLVVLERSARGCRALAARIEADELAVEACAGEPDVEWGSEARSRRAVEQLLRRLDAPYRDTIVVTDQACLEVVWGAGTPRSPDFPLERAYRAAGWTLCQDPRAPADGRCLVASLGFDRRAFWGRTLRALGKTLQGIYPLAGAGLPGLRLERLDQPVLLVQLEADGIALIEALGERCMSVELHAGPPTPERCVELIGEACPEVLLCGAGADLSELGYRIVRSTRTWVRLPRLRQLGSSLDRSHAAMIGAARHACGLSATDALACVPIYGS